ncbi:TonB-dependent receptor [Puteibacter caeruleilacunae]|nr:TonB-dependent receptor [Puteibacter caeruleilacunae]
MKERIKYTLLIICTLLSLQSFSEDNLKKVVITGKVVEKESNTPIEYATIALLEQNGNLVTGGISNKDGSFQLESPNKDFYIKVSFIGYQAVEIHDFKLTNNRVELNAIQLTSTQAQLNDIVVRAEKSKTEFKLDKRVFNVGKDLVGAGGSALDILNNVPSVDVSIEGTISLRGNTSVQMLINGKPSVMASDKTLGTITADMIEKVEVVTNPSAKYDAEGTSGIINIILKKDNKKGLNGAITGNIGTPKNYSLGLSMNRRTEKLNLFTQLGVGDRRFLSESYNQTINYKDPIQPQVVSIGDTEKNEQFYNFILGADYLISKYQTLSVSGHYGYENEKHYSTTDYSYTELSGENSEEAQRNETTTATNPKWQYEVNYTKEFADNKERKLTASATGSFFGKDKTSTYNNTGAGNYINLNEEKILNDFSDAEYSFQTDYTHPFSEKTTLETGAKVNINSNKNDLTQFNQVNNSWQIDENNSNRFNFDQAISAIYGTYAYEGEKIGFKAGLRGEYEYRKSKLDGSSQDDTNNDTKLFPSFHTSYNFNEKISVQAGYSKRIRRPHMWDINPFASYTDPLNVSKGNPDLKPSLSDSYELTAISNFKSSSINVSLFHRKTDDVVDRVYIVSDNVTTRMPINVGENKRTGIEMNSKLEPLKWLSFLAEGYYMYYKRTGEYQEQDFNFENDAWSGKMTMKLKLPYDIDAEYKFRYYSKTESLQGFYKAVNYSDFGMRKKFMKGKGVVHLSVRDLFDSRKQVFESKSADFKTYRENQRSGRIVVVGVSFGFGKGDTMEYSGMKMF